MPTITPEQAQSLVALYDRWLQVVPLVEVRKGKKRGKSLSPVDTGLMQLVCPVVAKMRRESCQAQ